MPGQDVFIADQLSWQNHAEGKDGEMSGSVICIDAVHRATDIPESM